MSYKAVVSGQLNLVDETKSQNKISFDLAEWFGSITGIREYKNVTRELINTDTVVSIPTDGVSPIKGFAIWVSGSGSVIVKHDANSAGIEVTKALVLFGEIDLITIETASTQALTVEYVFFQ